MTWMCSFFNVVYRVMRTGCVVAVLCIMYSRSNYSRRHTL